MTLLKVFTLLLGLIGVLLVIGAGGGDPHIVSDAQVNWAAAIGGFGMMGLAWWINKLLPTGKRERS